MQPTTTNAEAPAAGAKLPKSIVPVTAFGLCALASYAVWRVVSIAWACDDAFITYRYALNFARGDGLVFNVGERVEAYTNFLLTVVLAGGIRAGLAPLPFSQIIGGVAYLAVAGVLAWWSYARRARAGVWIPIGSAIWLVQDDLHAWATGGLETSLFAALALAGTACFVRARRRARDCVLGGTLLALACLTRPDGVLFALSGLVTLAALRDGPLRSRRTAVDLALAAAPMVIIGSAFVAFKLTYYGRLLPTTFYAKSAAVAYYAQGLTYVGLYFGKHWALTLALLAFPGAVIATRRWQALRARADAWLALFAFALFAGYVAHSGGDYMFARRLVPALPFLFVFLDAAADALALRASAPAAAAAVALSLFPYPVMSRETAEFVMGITDERLYYYPSFMQLRKTQGLLAKELFAGLPVRAGVPPTMCMFAYYSELPYMVETSGLTQYWGAEQPLERAQGRIGHEKAIGESELLAHDVHVVFENNWVAPNTVPRFDEMIIGGTLRVRLLQYDERLARAVLGDRRVRFTPIDALLREARADMRGMGCEEARETAASLSRYHPPSNATLTAFADEVCAR